MAEKEVTALTQIDKIESLIYTTINNLPTTLQANERLCLSALKMHQGTLLMGALALWNIGEHGLYVEAGFKTLAAYMQERAVKLGIEARARSTVSEYLNMAENFIRNQDALYKAGFQESRDSGKLKHLHIAEENHGKKDAIKNLPKMNTREYASWARGNMRIAESGNEAEAETIEMFDITERGFIMDGKLIVSKKKVENIIERGELPTVIGVRDENEARMLRKALKKAREEEEE